MTERTTLQPGGPRGVGEIETPSPVFSNSLRYVGQPLDTRADRPATPRARAVHAQRFLEIVSGRERSLTAAAARAALGVAEGPYALAIALRNWRYDRNSDAVRRVSVPVISVGNLTVGGSGKTPMVKWIARRLRDRGVRVAIVSRGYGAQEGARNDEALELEQALPDVPHLQNPDRVAGATAAIEELDAQAILLDDAFQHRRLARDLDIVLLDATEPFGYGRLLPRGVLREPVASLRRAHVVCLTRADLVDASARESVRRRAQQVAPDAIWCEAAHRPQSLLHANGGRRPLAELAGTRVAAFCGIGNPPAFRRTLGSLGVEVVAWRPFPDHHNYTRDDVEALADEARRARADAILCTHKDLAKVQAGDLGGAVLWAVEIEMDVLAGRESLQAQVDAVTSRLAQEGTGGERSG